MTYLDEAGLDAPMDFEDNETYQVIYLPCLLFLTTLTII